MFSPIYIVFGVLFISIVVLLAFVIFLERKLNRFLIDKDISTVGKSVESLHQYSKDNEVFKSELTEYLNSVEKRLRRSTQAVSTLRFNPFKGTGSGGNQSFVTTFLNEEGDGVILSSLYARDHVSIYSKPIKKFVSEFDLSDEEATSLKESKEKINQIKLTNKK